VCDHDAPDPLKPGPRLTLNASEFT
jgi:hypothetical protein